MKKCMLELYTALTPSNLDLFRDRWNERPIEQPMDGDSQTNGN